MSSLKVLLVAALFVFGQFAFAGFYKGGGKPNPPPAPNQPTSPSGQLSCMDHGKTLDVNNDQALQWRDHQSSGFHARALISGTVDEVFSDQTGHRHFSVKIGPNPNDHIEVIYKESFGQMPMPVVGDNAEACGDYIVATQSNGGYPPSPDGALVHWVHKSPNGRHDSGFVILNGKVYGGL